MISVVCFEPCLENGGAGDNVAMSPYLRYPSTSPIVPATIRPTLSPSPRWTCPNTTWERHLARCRGEPTSWDTHGELVV